MTRYADPAIDVGRLEAVILQALPVGKSHAISRGALMYHLRQHGFTFKDDRPVRQAMSDMRKRGIPVCGRGGIGGGYFFPENYGELNEYRQRELIAKGTDLLEQARGLEHGALTRFLKQGELWHR